MLRNRCHFGKTKKGGMSNTHSFRLFFVTPSPCLPAHLLNSSSPHLLN